MFVGWIIRRVKFLQGTNGKAKEEQYIFTSPPDGRKYIDADRFIKRKKVREQMKQLEKIVQPDPESTKQS